MSTHTRVYDSYGAARKVVADLEASGVASSDVSLMANRHVSAEYADVDDVATGAGTGAGVGAAVGGGAGLLAGLGLLAIPGLGPIVAAGWLASTAVGALAGAATGGLIGALTDAGVPEEHANVYAESVRRGGTMVTARVPDAEDARAAAIMDRAIPIDPVKRGDEYRSAGWTRFDPEAAPYRPSDVEIERIRRPYVG
jgi:hypothetical protein